MRILLKLFVLGIGLCIVGCQSSISTETASTSVLISPTAGAPLSMTPILSTPSDPAMQDLIQRAKEDLARRFSIPISQIDLVEMTEVEWSDSSLGCPEPGTDYLQVITPGYLIVLESNGTSYEYHSKGDISVIYCANPNAPGALPELK